MDSALDKLGVSSASNADNKLPASEGLNSTSRPPPFGVNVRGSEITSCCEIAPRKTPPVTNACGDVYCKIGSFPHTGRVESCKDGVPDVVAEKTKSADSANPADPHHSMRVRPFAGTSTC